MPLPYGHHTRTETNKIQKHLIKNKKTKMTKPIKNRKNIRWRSWDYRWDGAYFITICTDKRQHFFGEIVDKKMVLSNVGVLADVFC
jgi:hypothetical protein